jgi:hypothetical protein
VWEGRVKERRKEGRRRRKVKKGWEGRKEERRERDFPTHHSADCSSWCMHVGRMFNI